MIAEVRMKQAVAALASYRYREDLNSWLKNYMKAFPSMGSRDRRELRALVYGAVRMARLFPEATVEQQIGMGQVFAAGPSSDFVQYARSRSGWDLPSLPVPGTDTLQSMTEPGYDTLQSIPGPGFDAMQSLRGPGFDALQLCRHWAQEGLSFRADDWFPAHNRISSSIDQNELLKGFLMPPRTWVRLRAGREKVVENEWCEKAWLWGNSETTPNARWVESGRPLNSLNSFQSGFFEVQDLASQRTIRFMNPSSGESWWDACAGSGGKSLLLHDREPGVKLFATDERQSTLQQLHERFTRAGIRSYSRYCVDIDQRDPLEQAGSFPRQFDAVLADVPCSGSGTWSATPDWLSRFEQHRITEFAERQFRLVSNLLPYVREGGRLVYLSCSLYADENEQVVDRLCSTFGWQCLDQGYEQASLEGGDVLFGAVLSRR
jgi:16S rRNA (cytosine967-C5)-methyltransferase